MKYSNRNMWATLLLFITSCSRHEEGIKVGSSFRFRELINIHESPTIWISVNGRRFDNVRGKNPYHVEIPEIGGIFFVTSIPNSTDYDCHFFLLGENRDIKIRLSSGYLGGGIGYPRGSATSDWIDSANSSKVVVVHQNLENLTRFEFDLKHATFTKSATIEHRAEDVRSAMGK